jgi:hypothetical protein
MSSSDEMRPQSGKHAADAADDDIVVADEETAAMGPGRGPWVAGSDSRSAPTVGTEPTANGDPGGVSSAADDDADGLSPVANGEPGGVSSVAADDADGASPAAAAEPGGVSWVAADDADGASPAAAGEPGGMSPPAADPGPRNGPLTGASAAPQTTGTSPTAGDPSRPGGRDPWTSPTSAGEGTGPPAGGGAASRRASASKTAPAALRDDRSWREIQGMFVDDPRDSVQRASDLIDTAIEEFLAAVRQRQATVASSWQNSNADTEVLRVALKDYRALWAVVRDMPAVGATGGAAAVGAGTGGSSFGTGTGGAAGRYEPERGGTSA